jgi:hypothetical protein
MLLIKYFIIYKLLWHLYNSFVYTSSYVSTELSFGRVAVLDMVIQYPLVVPAKKNPLVGQT